MSYLSEFLLKRKRIPSGEFSVISRFSSLIFIVLGESAECGSNKSSNANSPEDFIFSCFPEEFLLSSWSPKSKDT